jgi:hypothetical protein
VQIFVHYCRACWFSAVVTIAEIIIMKSTLLRCVHTSIFFNLSSISRDMVEFLMECQVSIIWVLIIMIVVGAATNSLSVSTHQTYSALDLDSVTVCVGPVSSNFYQALWALYNSTNGDAWNWLPQNVKTGYAWDFSIGNESTAALLDRPCKDNWQGLTCVPSPVGHDQCDIGTITLERRNMKGPLPAELANISSMEYLYLADNCISGTIPTELALLRNLQALGLEGNYFSGPLPSELSLLSATSTLQLASNSLTGPIPLSVYSMTWLTDLDLEFNYLTSSISSSIGNLSALETFSVNTNYLTGSIATEIGLIRRLQFLFLEFTYLTGTIPSTIGDIGELIEIEFNNCYISGPVPETLANNRNLIALLLYDNQLSSTIPGNLGNLSSLEVIDLENCGLSGSIPVALSNAHSLIALVLDENYLTGQIPDEYAALHFLGILMLTNNFLSGTLPSSFGSNMPEMIHVNLGGNYLTASIPSEYSNFSHLEALVLGPNYLSKGLPDSLSPQLLLFQVNNNFHSGVVHGLFKPRSRMLFPDLLLADISDNAFSGSFPSTLFSLSLIRLSASSNCFEGELLCDIENGTMYGSSLEEIDLEGLSSGIGCRTYVIPTSLLSTSGYYPNWYMKGGIPSCIWSLPSLRALYLIGNGFTGPIVAPLNATLIPKLVNLSLRVNALTGTIPDFLLEHQGYQLMHLSYNRFHGTLPEVSRFCNNRTEVEIVANRLSGPLNRAVSCGWWNVASQVLQGNMFTFPVDSLDGETKEIALVYYGSYTLDIAMILSSLAYAAVIMLALVSYVLNSPDENLKLRVILNRATWFRLISSWQLQYKVVSLPSDWQSFFTVGIEYAQYVLVLLALALGGFLTLYLILKKCTNGYGTHVNQYRWIISAAYLHGVVPVVLVAVFLVSLILLLERHRFVRELFLSSNSSNPSRKRTSVSWKRQIQLIFMLSINVGVVGSVNTGYLFAVLNNNPQIQAIQLGLSAFKLLWNSGFTMVALSVLKFKRKPGKLSMNSLTFRFLIKLGNFVIIPCIVTSLIDPNCFYNLFSQEPESLIYSPRCYGTSTLQINLDSVDQVVLYNCSGSLDELQTPLTPPFVYSFQCSSALISNYVPIVLYSCVITGLFVPLSLLIVLYWLDTSKWLKSGRLDYLFDNWLPRILKPPHLLSSSSLTTRHDSVSSISSSISSATLVQTKVSSFPIEALQGTLLLNLTLLGSFGLAFPYLGGIILCSALLEAWAWMLAIGRYHKHIQAGNRTCSFSRGTLPPLSPSLASKSSFDLGENASDISKSFSTHSISSDVIGVSGEIVDILQLCQAIGKFDVALVVIIVFLFWSLLFFDMVGDIYGRNSGLAALFSSLFGGPLISLLFLFHFVSSSWNRSMNSPDCTEGDPTRASSGVEMAPTIQKSQSAVISYETFYDVQSAFENRNDSLDPEVTVAQTK